ncbi:MAG TPA: NADH-quinone oxidoreductase subunit NuoE [Mycobacteriales bacterium]|nr:NADH-quinone oxidoreductase subunit NuoE [Mycobacteriales bacterium]
MASEQGTVDLGLPASTTVPAGVPPLTEQSRAEAREIMARYPRSRSALLPMLHLVQSVQGYVSPQGIALCAEELGLTKAEVGAVATFYSMYRRTPAGTYHVGVCTNTLCAVLGGDAIFDALKDHLGIGHNQTTEDGTVSLEHIECNAACDFAPVVMVNWEFYDDQTPGTARELVDSLRAGAPLPPTRGPKSLPTFTQTARVLAGFNDGRGAEGVTAGPASLVGLELARSRGDQAPPYPAASDDTPANDGQEG